MLKAVNLVSRYKYFITALLFFIWISIFDRNSFLVQYRLSEILQSMEEENEFYQQSIIESYKIEEEMQQNLEKFAREKYFLHKEDEVVFIVAD